MSLLDINKNLVVLTGAGISAESGLPTFRSNGGLWQNHRVEDVASPKAFERSPELVHQFYNERRQHLLSEEIKPNNGHVILARMEQHWLGNFTLITQNVDNLHERAGSKNILHMHGEILKARCTQCNSTTVWFEDLSVENKCPICFKQTLRPDIIWFGEQVRQLNTITKALSECALFIAVGTSGNVYPASEFATIAGNAVKIEFNLANTVVSEYFNEHYFGPASQSLTDWYQKISVLGSL